MNTIEIKTPIHLKLMMSWGPCEECDITQICHADPELMKLVKLITSRKIVNDAIWTTYRIAKMKILLGKIAAEDDLVFDCKKILPNVVLVHWYNDNSYTIYRLVY